MTIKKIRWNKITSYFWTLFGILGVVLFWAGIWDGIGHSNKYFANPLISLFIGVSILVFASLSSREFHFLEEEHDLAWIIHKIKRHPQKHEFQIHYHDRLKGKNIIMKGNRLKRVEKDSILIFEGKGKKEYFLPIHRVKKVLHKGKPVR